MNAGHDDDVDGPLPHDDVHLHHLKHMGTMDTKSNNSFPDQDSINNEAPFMDQFPKLMLNLTDRFADTTLQPGGPNHYPAKDLSSIRHNHHFDSQPNLNSYEQNSVSSGHDYYVNYNANVAPSAQSIYATSTNAMAPSQLKLPIMAPVPTYHNDHCYCFDCQQQYRYHNILVDRRKTGVSPHAQMTSPHQLHMNQSQSQYFQQIYHENNYWNKNDLKAQQVCFENSEFRQYYVQINLELKLILLNGTG